MTMLGSIIDLIRRNSDTDTILFAVKEAKGKISRDIALLRDAINLWNVVTSAETKLDREILKQCKELAYSAVKAIASDPLDDEGKT